MKTLKQNCIKFAKNLLSFSWSALESLMVFLVAFYRTFLSGIFGGNCRYYPSCSVYAEQALKQLPAQQSIPLIFKRVLSCHPLGKKGYDPVPQINNEKESIHAK